MLFVIIASIISSSTAVVYNLTLTPAGLTIPCREGPGTDIGTCRVSSTGGRSDSIGIGSIQNIPDGAPIGTHLASSTPLCIDNDSEFARTYSRVMLTPSVSSTSTYELITDVNDPSQYCFDGTISLAQFTSPISFHTRVTLVPSNGRVVSSRITGARRPLSAFYDINTESMKDVISQGVFNSLMLELEELSGTPDLANMNFASIMQDMPSIQYTIYHHDGGSRERDEIARVVLEPIDYLKETLDGVYELQVRSADANEQPQLGMNFLNAVAVFIDYENEEIGFCEPL